MEPLEAIRVIHPKLGVINPGRSLRVRCSGVISSFELVFYIPCSRKRGLKKENNYEIVRTSQNLIIIKSNRAYRA